MHCQLRPGFQAGIEKINLFEPGDGPILEFHKSGFKIKQVKVDGELRNFAEYLREESVDTRLPLISQDGDDENVSFQRVNEDTVQLYAPVFKEERYRLAKGLTDYHSILMDRVKNLNYPSYFSCNCILNYKNDNLTDKDIGELSGPVTFGEISNHLLNQTFVSLYIKEA
ncbi:MAG: hypothetical protein PF447_00055 [Spirochaetaceae bacterium]|jgi:hypothetical protein|nr:hypothetical protein [Spirochaetaceae bacterium]